MDKPQPQGLAFPTEATGTCTVGEATLISRPKSNLTRSITFPAAISPKKQAEVAYEIAAKSAYQLARSPGIPWYFHSSTDSTNPETSYLRPIGRQNSSKPQFNSSANVR